MFLMSILFIIQGFNLRKCLDPWINFPYKLMKSSPSIWNYAVSIKSTVKISSIFVAFLENTNFKTFSFDNFQFRLFSSKILNGTQQHINCMDLAIKNPSIYNIIHWVAWMMGQTNGRPSVWCSKYFFFHDFFQNSLQKFFQFIFLYFFIKLQK